MNTKNKVLIGTSSFAELDKTPLKMLLEAGYEVVNNPYKRKLAKNELIELLPGIAGLIAGLETIDREVMERSTLKVISRCGAGISNVDLKAAQELGIDVLNTPTAPAVSVAELTVGCLLSLLRNVPEMDDLLHKGSWAKKIGRQLSGLNVAVIGYGNIGRKVCQLLTAFGAKILVVDPILKEPPPDLELLRLNEALARADVITLHLSGDECILGKKEFDLIKKGVYILNAARGGLIDEKALIGAIEEGKVAGAWLDTFEKEPYNGPLTQYKQVILTPHVGSYTLECRKQMETEAAANLINAFKKRGL